MLRPAGCLGLQGRGVWLIPMQMHALTVGSNLLVSVHCRSVTATALGHNAYALDQVRKTATLKHASKHIVSSNINSKEHGGDVICGGPTCIVCETRLTAYDGREMATCGPTMYLTHIPIMRPQAAPKAKEGMNNPTEQVGHEMQKRFGWHHTAQHVIDKHCFYMLQI